MPKVSIIVPIYKVEPYLSRCIDSALAQTVTDYELILVDDGSPDGCPAICESYAQQDSRIRVIHKENGGLSSARNAGLDVAKGTYIYFLDSDDFISPYLLETVIPYMDDGADLVAFNFSCVDEKTGAVTQKVNYAEQTFLLSTLEDRCKFLTLLPTYKVGWEAWSRIFRRSIIEDNQIRFADNRKVFAEDLYFSLCYCAKAVNITSINACLYFYLQRTNSIMGVDSQKSNIGRMNELSKAVYTYWSSQADCHSLLEVFPVVHALIIQNAVDSYRRAFPISVQELRALCLQDIEDQAFFWNQLRRLPSMKKWLYQIYPGSRVAELLSVWRYYRDGFYPGLVLRNRLIYKFAEKLDLNSPTLKELRKGYQQFLKNDRRIYLLGTEEFGNLGDHKINEAVLDFLWQAVPDAVVREVTLREFSIQYPLLKKYIRPEDTIVFPGGGNLGNQYIAAENTRERIIHDWPENKKIVFPQTIFFTDTEKGNECLQSARKAYTIENNVVLFTRERLSFEFAQKNFSCESYLVPDIVLSCNEQIGAPRDEKILFCMRSDVEKVIEEAALNGLMSAMETQGYCIETMDLQLDCHVDKKDRKFAVESALNKIRKCNLLITDRLHGMVFAAITGTPCVALGNYNYKVKGTYEWIRHLPYIRFADNIAHVDALIPELLAIQDCKYDNSNLLPYYDKIKEVLLRK